MLAECVELGPKIRKISYFQKLTRLWLVVIYFLQACFTRYRDHLGVVLIATELSYLNSTFKNKC